jgi:hypothetical protein
MSIDDEQKGENDNDEEFDLRAMEDDAAGDDLVSPPHLFILSHRCEISIIIVII